MEPSVLDTSPCLFQRKFSFDELADPLKKIAIPQHGPQNKLPNYTIMDTKYQNGLRKQIIATAKLTHLRSNQRYIAIFATTSCKSTLDNVPYFGIDGLSMILCLWHPPSTPHQSCQQYKTMLKTWRNNFKWEGGGRSVLYLTDL